MPQQDQHVHRFLWRNFGTNRKPDEYVKTVLTFGDKPAPAMAQIALQKTAKESQNTHPPVAKALMENFYMDDICDSLNTVEGARKQTEDLDSVLEKGRFKVKGWISNRDLKEQTHHENTVEMKMFQGNTDEKVLGMVWKNNTDMLTFKVRKDLLKLMNSKDSSQEGLQIAERLILSRIARIYDPIGFEAAFLIRAKRGMRQLWQMGCGWNQELPPEVCQKWIGLFQELEELNGVTYPRCLTPTDAMGLPTLCIFSDGSREVFNACAHIKFLTSNGNYVSRFVVAKSRVAPLKGLPIPRLELQVAVLATRLGKSICKKSRMQFGKIIYFTNSKIALA